MAPVALALPDLARDRWRRCGSHPQVVGAAPFMAAQALLARGEDMQGAYGARHRPGRWSRR